MPAKSFPGKFVRYDMAANNAYFEKKDGSPWARPLRPVDGGVMDKIRAAQPGWVQVTVDGDSLLDVGALPDRPYQGGGGGAPRTNGGARPARSDPARDRQILAATVIKAHIGQSGEWPKPALVASYVGQVLEALNDPQVPAPATPAALLQPGSDQDIPF